MAFLCCCKNCQRRESDSACCEDPKKEILRLRVNWLFIMVLGSLYAISYTAISSSFHQFMTNPTAESLNQSERSLVYIEPGLGQSEVFYSWVITLFNIGALFGALGTGFAIKFIPYWHLILFGLLSHTLGYVIYALTNTGWLIMISKFLSGIYIGLELTIALAYFAESSLDYQVAHKALGNTKVKSDIIRNRLFALHNIGVSVGYVLGPGAAAVFAQFDINQFRSIAWYNVAGGVAFIALLVLMFHGEASCRNLGKRSRNCCKELPILNTNFSEIFILVFLIIGRGVLSFRFGAYETVYNPVLSDYFGFTERDSSYFFFGLVLAQISGTLILLLLQYIKLNSRVIAIIGLLMSIIAAALMADWQSIPSDPCTQLSPFHHPELVDNYSNISTIQAPSELYSMAPLARSKREGKCMKFDVDPVKHLSLIDSLHIYADIQPGSEDVDNMRLMLPADIKCTPVDHCERCADNNKQNRENDTNLHVDTDSLCLQYTMSTELCLVLTPYNDDDDGNDVAHQTRDRREISSYACAYSNSPLSVCMELDTGSPDDGNETSSGLYAPDDQPLKEENGPSEKTDLTDLIEEILNENKHAVHSQALQVLDLDVYTIAMNECESAVVPNHECYWVPNSRVTKHHCGDCQPICRSLQRSLNFAQFVLGASLLMVAIPIAWVPIAALISDRVPRAAQGIVMGVVMSLCAVGRSISPLWLDAAYEFLQKRTVLASGLLMLSHIPFVIGVLVLYRKLGQPPDSGLYKGNEEGKEEQRTFSDSDIETSDYDSADETAQLVPQ